MLINKLRVVASALSGIETNFGYQRVKGSEDELQAWRNHTEANLLMGGCSATPVRRPGLFRVGHSTSVDW